MAHYPGKFVWYEHMSNDVGKARKFYDALFGWRTEGFPMGGQTYYMIHNGKDGIGGYRTAPPGVLNHWISYLSVDDVDASHKAALAAGGKSFFPPTDMPPIGRLATIGDPVGATLSLWRSADADRPDAADIPVGEFYWTECVTTDDRKAVDFYRGVFGFEVEPMDMGGGMTYHLLKKGGIPRAGVIKPPMQIPWPHWLPYVRVSDCDASVTKAESLGAKVVVPARDIPGVGRFAALLDPLDAPIAVIHKA